MGPCFTWNVLSKEPFCAAIRGRTPSGTGFRATGILLCGPLNPARPDDQGAPITYSSILLAILVGIAHAGLAPAVVVGGVKPNLVLVAVVLVTTNFGFIVVSVLTLGIWVPSQIEYSCAADRT